MNDQNPFNDAPAGGAKVPEIIDADVFNTQARVDKLRANFGMDPGATTLMTRTKNAGSLSTLRPRQILTVRDNCIKEAEVAGTEFFYRWEVTDKKTGEVSEVKGLSVQGAMCVSRYWGNCDVDADMVSETHEAWIFAAAFVDKETNFTVRRPFRMSKSAAMFGNMDAERKDIARFNKGCSMAMRNAVEDGVPSWLVKEVVEAAQNAAIGDVKDALAKRFEGKVELFAHWLFRTKLQPWGVTPQAMLAKFNRSSLKAFTVYDLVKVKLDAIALESETTTAAMLYPSPGQKPAEPEGQHGAQQAAASQSQTERPAGPSAAELEGFGKGPEPSKGGKAAELAGKAAAAASGPTAAPQDAGTASGAASSSSSGQTLQEARQEASGASDWPEAAETPQQAYKRLLKAAKNATSVKELAAVNQQVADISLPATDLATLNSAVERKVKALGGTVADLGEPDEADDDFLAEE